MLYEIKLKGCLTVTRQSSHDQKEDIGKFIFEELTHNILGLRQGLSNVTHWSDIVHRNKTTNYGRQFSNEVFQVFSGEWNRIKNYSPDFNERFFDQALSFTPLYAEINWDKLSDTDGEIYVYFISEPILLLEAIGSSLICAQTDKYDKYKNGDNVSCFTLELSKDLTIGIIKKLE